MAGAGQPWYMPALWPIGHLFTAFTKPVNDKPAEPVAEADLDLTGANEDDGLQP